ncbi:MAG: DNA primase [Candidatus Thermoplasmatota archaeon]|nr:DNA primase [Euryarchaeota archaeon]MBU4032225.1 DNA primase [Candidatus Thermoplasmatota archaeon]MBU4071913.1 DNA primase [Candidatus Thermoplasmatota archaeon]MBU4144214.1 DNA primase [Candidatus Thermoplasmatota archaeon]MBU4591102.1 DNA primase [Candidatus Thermoplasmatota archaeon]
MNLDPNTTKYLIRANISADGVVEKPDVVGAIFGQTEGLLGDELDLRDLQKGGRIGRIEVDVNSTKGKSEGVVEIPSGLDQVETAILASALETIDRVGPCKARVKILGIEDVRVKKRDTIIERAKELLSNMLEDSKNVSGNLAESVKEAVQIQEILTYGPEHLPAGPNVINSDAIIVVEGRNDVLNLLKAGIKNAIAVEGTNIPKTVIELSKQKTVTVFVDGDRGGELILRELLQTAEIDFITRAPPGKEVEELTSKQIMKALRHKVMAEQAHEILNQPTTEGGQPNQQNQRGGNDFKNRKDNQQQQQKGGQQKQMMKRPERPEESVQQRTPPPAPKKEEPKLSDEQRMFRDLFKEVVGNSKARLISEANAVIAEMAVKDLAEALKGQKDTQGIKAVVFDGIITQRLLDISSDMGIGTLVATKMGKVSKLPDGLTVLTKEDFE